MIRENMIVIIYLKHIANNNINQQNQQKGFLLIDFKKGCDDIKQYRKSKIKPLFYCDGPGFSVELRAVFIQRLNEKIISKWNIQMSGKKRKQQY